MQISSISTVLPKGGSAGTEKPCSTRHLDFFSHGTNGIAADTKRSGNTSLRNALSQGAFDVSAFFVRKSSMPGVQGERFAAVFAAAAFRAVAVRPKRANRFGVLAMRAGKRDHATIESN